MTRLLIFGYETKEDQDARRERVKNFDFNSPDMSNGKLTRQQRLCMRIQLALSTLSPETNKDHGFINEKSISLLHLRGRLADDGRERRRVRWVRKNIFLDLIANIFKR